MMTLETFNNLLCCTPTAIKQALLVEEDTVDNISTSETKDFLVDFYTARIEYLTETLTFFNGMVAYLARNGLNKKTKAYILKQIQEFETDKKNELLLKYGKQAKAHLYVALLQFTEVFTTEKE